MKIIKLRKCAPEKNEQAAFAAWLGYDGYIFCYVPNDMLLTGPKGRVNYGWLASMTKRGLQPGFPDYLIFGDKRGRPLNLAIEMKRKVGGKEGPHQKQAMARLRSVGWTMVVAHGSEEARWIVESVAKGSFRW